MHPDDHAAVMEVLRSTIMATQTTKTVQCRIKNAYIDKYVPVDVTLRCGRQGIIYFLRLLTEGRGGDALLPPPSTSSSFST